MSLLDALLRTELSESVVDPTASAKEVFFAIRADGQVGSGTESDPFDGSTPARFDAVMAGLSGGEVVRLGPGIFLTQGEESWFPRSGQRIVGSGVHSTALRLALTDPNSDRQYHVIGQTAGKISGFELGDLTIDCDLAGQPDTGSGYARIMAGGLDLRGYNILIRRVRVINFGTNTSAYECFGISVGFADPGDNPVAKNCVVESCIVEKPALNNARETTCINLSANELQATLEGAHHEDCVIRNNYVNCEYVRATAAKPVLRVQSLTRSGTTATLTTYGAHGRVVNDWIVVTGGTDPGGGTYQQLGLTAVWNGSFKVTSVSQDGKSLTYIMDSQPASASAGGEIWLGKAPSALLVLDDIDTEQDENDDYWVILRTSSPHFRFLGSGSDDGDYVLIRNIQTTEGGTENAFNGYYQIKEVPEADYPSRTFKYNVGSEYPGTPSGSAAATATVGCQFQGMGGGGGRRAVVERNRVYNCRVGGPYHDSHNTRSLIVRKNYYYNVYTGIYENLGARSSGKLAGTISQTGSGCTFNLSGGLANPFALGEVVEITKAADGALLGHYEVIGTAANSFTFTEPDQVPSVDYNAARAYTVGQLWIEDNVIEMALFPAGTQGHAAPSGVTLIAPTAFNDLPMIRKALVRGNLIRHVGGLIDPCWRGDSRGVDVSCCRRLIVESNLIGVEGANWAVRHYHCGKVKSFNNLTFAGEPLCALKWDVDPPVHTPEIRTQAEELFLGRL